MKYVTILFFMISVSICNAQTVSGKKIEDIDAKYIRIVGTAKFLSTKVVVDIEFGQHNKMFDNNDTKILDKNGKPKVFNSMVEAMNFMANFGYKFVSAYAITVNNQNVYHYLMERNN
ncbi:DUF6705 family protein [Aureispira anguillae]|uniref:DUF6705 domain-containing protein n=1 Tax=Aureispira anguillae TaxID=2864201 RepID=A0A915YM00_9BACT|nr:hypothetical protein [Aureispira anguillae]BDS15484.1 hypothetical protein AsAng_0062680 [Aureispira anguillae]